MEKQIEDKEKGITMIALIVTIVILIILAGVGIMGIYGDNGILKRSLNAKDSAAVKSEIRMVEVAANSAMLKNKYGKIEEETLVSELAKTAGKNKTIVEKYDEGLYFLVEFKDSGRVYEVSNEEGVRYIGAHGNTLISGIINANPSRDSSSKTNREIEISFRTIDEITNKNNIDIKYAWIEKSIDIPENLEELEHEIDSNDGKVTYGIVNTNEITKGYGKYYLYIEVKVKDGENIVDTIKKVFGEYEVGEDKGILASYTVKHYFMNTSGEYTDDPIVERFKGKIGNIVTPNVKTEYGTMGFKLPEVQQAIIKNDGTTVIEYRYERYKVTLIINVNGGTLAEERDEKYTGVDEEGYVMVNNERRAHTILYYGGKTSSSGLINYDNSSVLNIEKERYTAKPNEEWNTRADGTGRSYDQGNIVWNASDFADVSQGDVTVSLYVNWYFNPKMTINFYANGAQKNNGVNLTSDLLRTKSYRYHGKNWNKSTGVPDYVGSTATWNLTKQGYHWTRQWHVGSPTSSTTINVKATYPTMRDVAEAMGLLNQFNQGDITVNIYAGWELNT